MKKNLLLTSIIFTMVLTSGCSSYIAAKYDNYNETFQGKAYYDPSYGRASISLKSDVNSTICTGSTPFYQGIYVYNFNIVCSDGRMIMGSMNHGQYKGQAFTNRNETISFSINKNQKKFNEDISNFKNDVKNMPALDNKKEPIKVIIEPNKY